MDINNFKKKPIMGILRGIGVDQIEPLIGSAVNAGLDTLEITMNTKDAAQIIKKAVKARGKQIVLGAGTVINMEDLKTAIDSGATFIVMPFLVEGIMDYCVKNDIAVFPGALTPLEIYKAWDMGATMVKVFPAKFFGPLYFKEIKAPLNDIELLACGGVTADNINDYISSGASAVSFGESVFRKEWLKKKDYVRIEKEIKRFIDSFNIGVSKDE